MFAIDSVFESVPNSNGRKRVFVPIVVTLAFFYGVQAGLATPHNDVSSEDKTHKVVLIAGPITGHPKHTHEYEKNVILLKHLLDHADNLANLQTEIHFQGWPQDESTLDDADTIVFISDGSDRNESDHPLYVGDRFETLKRQMDRGCGLVMFHWSTFHPRRAHDEITRWVGGYFDYESGPAANGWYSAIQTWQSDVTLATAEHPIHRGVKPFRVQEEFYYRIRFAEKNQDSANTSSVHTATPILTTTPPGETDAYAVGWAIERENGGRGFGFTGGHFYRNWWNEDFRRAILNAIVWSAGVEVPEGGVRTTLDEPIRMLIVTGYHSPHHDWNQVTGGLIKVLEQDPRVFVDVTEDVEDLGRSKLNDYDMLVFNYCNWDRGGLSEAAKNGLTNYLKSGGGMSVIHFANGSFTDTVPNPSGDWPEFRTRIVRRIWVHGDGKSSHDAYGPFRVEPTEKTHPITDGLEPFDTYDELYFNQEGELPIEPLVTAHSRITGQDEPMAWAYRYGEGRIFQTVLGHAEPSIIAAGALIRRGSVWASGHNNLTFDPPVETLENYLWRSGASWQPHDDASESNGDSRPEARSPNPEPLAEGKFGNGLNATQGGVWLSSDNAVREPPLTVAAWVRLEHARGFNIIAASESKASPSHWELYTYAGSGDLSVYLPGVPPGEIRSEQAICDGAWHYVGFTYSPDEVALYVDGKKVKTQQIERPSFEPTKGPLAVGALAEGGLGCQGTIDDLTIVNSIVELTTIPDTPHTPRDDTQVYLSFDRFDKEQSTFENQGTTHSPALIDREQWLKQNQTQDDSQSSAPKAKVEGHWGEDAIGFAWQEQDSVDDRWQQTDIGPCLAGTFPIGNEFCRKGLAIQFPSKEDLAACFDTQHLTWRGVWRNGFLKFNPARYGLINHPQPANEPVFVLGDSVAWSAKQQAWIGYQQSGRQLALHYRLDSTHVREVPYALETGTRSAFVREITLQAHDTPFDLSLANDIHPSDIVNDESIVWCTGQTRGVTCVIGLVSPASAKVELVREDHQVHLRCRPNDQATTFQLIYWVGGAALQDEAQNAIRSMIDEKLGMIPHEHAFGESESTHDSRSIPLWNPPLEMPIEIGTDGEAPYVVDTFRPPFENPYGALLFISGHDFLQDGTAVVSTVHGDVWLVSDILPTEQGHQARWKRFATGLYQPLGVRVVDDQIYVLGRDQITRLHDHNQDGEADFYENFNNDGETSTGTHDYAAGLESDPEGNFYYVRGNTGVERVSADGRRHEVIATGLRNPNGIGMSLDGVLTAAPQEGQWTPASSIVIVNEGDYFGYGGPRVTDERPLGYDPPICWLPRLVDNSSGGQCWVDSDRWGPLSNHWLHLSFGRCWMMLVVTEEINGKTQGGVVQFPFEFDSGVCRARFHPQDGQLYVSGLRGWSSSAVQDGCFQRVRYTGKTVRMPIRVETVANGVVLGYSVDLDKTTANNRLNYLVERWNYRYAADYGSPEFSVSHPNQQGRDEVFVRSATLLDDRRSVFLEFEDQRPAMQMAIHYSLQDTNAQSVEGVFYHSPLQIGSQQRTPGKHASNNTVDERRAFEQRLLRGWLVDVNNNNNNRDDASTEERPISLADRFIVRTASFADPGKYAMSPFADSEWRAMRLHGYIKIDQPGKYQFVIEGAKPTSVEVGEQVLKPQSIASTPLGQQTYSYSYETERLPRGFASVRMTIDRQAIQGPFQIRWASEIFAAEPIPPNVLYHDPEDPQLAEFQQLRQGKSLYATRGCLQCHGTHEEKLAESGGQAFEVLLEAPSLEDVGQRLRPEWIQAWILDPVSLRSHATMPKLLDAKYPEDVTRATSIAAWLVQQSKGNAERSTEEQAATSELLRHGERLYERLGCIACHHLEPDAVADRFHRRSLVGVGNKYQPGALSAYLKEPGRYHHTTRMPDFRLSDEEARALAALILTETNQHQKELPPIDLQQADVNAGRQAFDQIGCRQCHVTQSDQGLARPMKQLTSFSDQYKGCLDPQVAQSRHIPQIELSVPERRALLTFLRSEHSPRVDTPREAAQRLVKHFNCLACHDRDGDRAAFAELVLDEGWTGLAPETLPDLTWAGEKLHDEWIESLVHGDLAHASRPWLEARMPAFPWFARSLAHSLTVEHGIDPSLPSPALELEPKLVEAGQRLTQLQHGFDCRQCHGVGAEPPSGDEQTRLALGINFSDVQLRLRRSYYERWMRDPLRIDALTKMPKYTQDNGRTKVETILDGNADEQYHAIWHYLQSLDRR